MANETDGCAGCLLVCAAIFIAGCVIYFVYIMAEGRVLIIVLALLFLGCVKFLSGK